MRKHLLEFRVVLTLVVLLVCCINLALTQDSQKQVTSPIYAGTWNGVFDFNGTKLHLVLKISAGDTSGNYKATMDSPDQGASDLPVDSVTADGDNFAFVMNAIGASYK